MIPLGLATLTAQAVPVGARLLRLSDHEVVLGDALVTLTAERAFVDAGDCEVGDLVRALVSSTADGSPRCLGLERLGRGQAHAAPTSAHALILSQEAHAAVRQYFRSEGFLEVQTPTFGVCPGLDPHVHALGSAPGTAALERTMTSPEFYMKRLLSRGLPRIFQLATVFRSEEIGPWHEPEFTLLEWYRAYESLDSVMTDTERLVDVVAETLRANGGSAPLPALDLGRPFARLSIKEAFRTYAGIADCHDLADADPAAYFQTFVDRVEPKLAELRHPVFLTEFPASQAALARLSPSDPRVALRFELVLGGIELCNGYDELTSASEQRARFEAELDRRRAAGEPTYPLDERFLLALTDGMPPAAGNALGLERLLAVLTGARRIEEFYAFPASAH
jgi:lysyl-tRNA synthetase class 2